MRAWGTGHQGLTELVRHSRIKVAVAAWAYENNHKPIMDDAAYDDLANLVHQERNIATGNHRLDRFFQRQFDKDTGLWVHKHPHPHLLENIYARYYQQPKRRRRKRR
jgi:hypothetical protein